MSAGALVAEAAKLPAFVRRDWKIALSYRNAFVTEVLAIAGEVLVLSFVTRLVDPRRMPAYGHTVPSYLRFVAIGLVVNLTVGVLLYQVSTAIRQEQLTGTLESLMVTPTAPATLQIGSVAYQLLALPIRAGLLLAAIAIGFGLDLHAGGLAPAALLLLAFMPFAWGMGLLAAAAVVTFRRGSGVTGLLVMGVGFLSGAFFPIALLPAWLRAVAGWNPFAITIDGAREALLGGTGWGPAGADLLRLAPLAASGLALGLIAFRAALARERRRGTLGRY